MIYVGRSSISSGFSDGPAATVFNIGRHHAKMVVDLWMAETSTYIGMPLGSDAKEDFPKAKIIMGVTECEGAIIVFPPGHGKTEVGAHWCARRISDNPYEQGWVIHAQEALAAQSLAYVASMFEMSSPAGRRNRALYPNIPTKFRKKNSKMFWLDLPNRTKQPTMSASGVRSKRSGADASFVWFDDPVDQREAEQDKERDRTYALINGTWLTRLRGKQSKGATRGIFHFTTTTLWHPDDANCRRIELARQKKLRILVSRQGTGGPRSFPKFEAVWPEMYPASKIEKIYEAMKNPTLFSAAYMSNPVAESLKIIRQLRFYDPASTDHVRFLKSCTNYLSLDPSATNRPGSDKVGIVHAGMGEFSWEEVSADGVPVYRCENRLRIVDANQIHATQSELVEYTCGYSLIKQVDHVIVETRSGFVAVAEMFENMHGIKPIRRDPGNKSKDVRLRAAAPALEDGNADDGIRAVVEFPGKRDEAGNIVPDERFDWLYRQILDFGFAAEDHCVDALTQLVNYLAPELSVGKGVVSRIMQEEVKQASNPRLKSVLSKWFSTPGDGEPAPMQDARWMLANQGAV